MEPIKVVYPKATLLAHTPEPEKVVAFAAKLCYSNTEPDKIWESLTDEEVSRYLSHLEGYGHESPIEHASFTFLITDMTRSCLAQITRHRIASFSVQSQRYINFSDFQVGVPEYIEYPIHHKLNNTYSPFSNYTGEKMQFRIDDAFVNAIAESKKDYILIRDRILFMLLSYFICENTNELFGDQEYIKIPENDEHMPYYATLEKKWYSEGYPCINPESDFNGDGVDHLSMNGSEVTWDNAGTTLQQDMHAAYSIELQVSDICVVDTEAGITVLSSANSK